MTTTPSPSFVPVSLFLSRLCFVLQIFNFFSDLNRKDPLSPFLFVAGDANRYLDITDTCAVGEVYLSPTLSCGTCISTYGSGTEVDPNQLDGKGNAFACRCMRGWKKVDNEANCAGSTEGTCPSFSCMDCGTSGNASYSDRSACVSCDDATTLGFSSTINDCLCASTGSVLVEVDEVGNKLPAKKCGTCPVGSQVITSSGNIAGVFYKQDFTRCQFCPDPILMTMSVGTDGSYSCSCIAGYTLVGVDTVGPLSCIRSVLLTAFASGENEAVRVQYFGSAKTTVRSMTFQHYYLKAVAECTQLNSIDSIKACQVLTNLCALSMFDDTAISCSNYISILDSRLEINNIDNWVYGNTWLYYSFTALGEACFEGDYWKEYWLTGVEMPYYVMSYTLNGTALGYQPLSTLLSYCTKDAPLSSQGGGTSSSTKYQIFGNSNKQRYSCELSNLFAGSQNVFEEQRFYELYLVDNPSRGTMSIPVRVTNLRWDNEDDINENTQVIYYVIPVTVWSADFFYMMLYLV